MKIYVDNDKRCHDSNSNGNFREVETDFFNGKCQTFIEGHCYDDANGYEAIYPWRDHTELDNAQREYERQLLKELQENSIPLSALEAAYQEGVNSAYD